MTRFAPQWLQGSTYAGGEDRRLLAALWPGKRITGCTPTPGAGMALTIAAGQLAVPLADGSTAILIILAMSFGLIVPKLIVDYVSERAVRS